MHRLWAIYPEALEMLLANGPLSSLGMRPSPARRRAMEDDDYAAPDRKPKSILKVDGAVATITITGVLTKAYDAWIAFWGEAQTTYPQIIEAARAALGDPAVKGVRFVIDSPGGDVDGHEAAMEAVSALTAAKPCVGQLGWCCSAAAWLSFAIPAANLAMGNDGLGGSIGVICTMHDMSGRYANAGIKPVVVASGDNKAFFGTAGLPLEQKHIDNVKGTFVEPAFARFKGAAMTARSLAADAPLFDGRVLTPAGAKNDGLIAFTGSENAVAAWASAKLAELIAALPDKSNNPASADAAANKDTTMKATLEQLRAAFGTDLAFCMEQLDKSATMEQAQAAWNAKQSAKITALEAEKSAAEKKANEAQAAADAAKAELAAKPKTDGHGKALSTDKPDGAGGGGNADAGEKGTVDAYTARVAGYEKSMSKPDAARKAKAEDPAGFKAWLTAERRSIGVRV